MSGNANWQLGHWLTGRLGASGLGELVRELCRRGGLPEGLVDTGRLIGVVPGYTVSGLESARASIEPLARFFAFDGVETGGQLRFVPRGGRAVAEIEPGELVAGEQREAEDIAFTRGQETELPRALKWRLTALDEEFGGLTVEARRITVDSARVKSEGFPIACSASLADRNARRALFEEWIGREEAFFALPPSRLALDPTDVVRIVHDGRAPEYALTRSSDGDGRRIEARRVDPLIYDLPPGPERKSAVIVPTVLGRPVALLMNLPQLAEDIPAGRPYAAVFASRGTAKLRSGAVPPSTASSCSTRWAGRRGSGRLPSISMAAPPGGSISATSCGLICPRRRSPACQIRRCSPGKTSSRSNPPPACGKCCSSPPPS